MADLRWTGTADLSELGPEAMRLAGDALLDEAKARAPELSGEMKDSGFVDIDGAEATVGFGSPYAVKQHYKKNYRHPRGGEAFFLKKAVDSFAPIFEQILAEEMRRRFGS